MLQNNPPSPSSFAHPTTATGRFPNNQRAEGRRQGATTISTAHNGSAQMIEYVVKTINPRGHCCVVLCPLNTKDLEYTSAPSPSHVAPCHGAYADVHHSDDSFR